MTRETYLTHYILQSGAWIKVAEYACETAQRASEIEAELRARHPADVARFEVR
jgi:hypothetical protein